MIWQHRIVSIFGTILFLATTGCSTTPGLSTGGTVVAPPKTQVAPAPDSAALERARLTQIVRASIAGRESEPATAVFENITVLTANVSAGNLIQAMNFYGVALGVSCSHCHDVNRFAADDKPQKAIAREMMRMNGVLNGQLLKGIAGLQDRNASVNCVTCHRGQLVPARALGAPTQGRVV
jgi:Photosynthetic reaction centre cytochrome C subunit